MDQKKQRQRIYILPTRFGLVFLVGSFLMILIGSAYQNNLVNLLAFFMLSLVFVCMVQTHNNLRDIRISNIETEGGFAGQEFIVTTVLGNNSKVPRFNIETRLREPRARSIYENTLPLLENGTLKLRASYPAVRRGRFQTNPARLSSVYPLGLFEAWTWYKISSVYYIYPEPKGDKPFPWGGEGDHAGHVTFPVGGEDFHGHRRFRDGDSQKHIDWKAFARGRPKLIKEFTEGAPVSIRLDWRSLEDLNTEDRLSQLSKWVDEAKDHKQMFSLVLPGKIVPTGLGISHAIRCWEALASFENHPDAKRAS
jgi:uncharacterized protein (DUF58 family)